MLEKLFGALLFAFSVFFLISRVSKHRIWEERLFDESVMIDWFINLRYLAFGVAIGISSVALYIFDLAESDLTKISITASAGLVGVTNLLFSALKRRSTPRTNLKIQIFTDLILLTVLIYLSGGIESPFFTLYAIHVFIAAVMFGSGLAYLVSLVSMALFSSVVILEFFGVLPHHVLKIGIHRGELVYYPLYVLSILFSLAILLFVSAYFISRLANSLREKLEEEKKIFADMVHAAKLAELGEFAGIISHEVNNFLGAIIMITKSILESHKEKIPEEVLKDIRAIDEQSMKSARTLQGILSFLYPAVDEVRFRIEESIDSVLRILQLRLKKAKIDVDVKFSETKPIKVNKGQIEQVILNLLNNSIDAIERKKAKEREKLIRVASYDDGDFLVLEISDSGEGMPANIKDKIFEPFFSTKPGGAGLGLYIARKIIQNHRGRIEFESEENKGTTFRIFLPYSD